MNRVLDTQLPTRHTPASQQLNRKQIDHMATVNIVIIFNACAYAVWPLQWRPMTTPPTPKKEPRLIVQRVPGMRGGIAVTEAGRTITVSANCQDYAILCKSAQDANLPTPAHFILLAIKRAAMHRDA